MSKRKRPTSDIVSKPTHERYLEITLAKLHEYLSNIVTKYLHTAAGLTQTSDKLNITDWSKPSASYLPSSNAIQSSSLSTVFSLDSKSSIDPSFQTKAVHVLAQTHPEILHKNQTESLQASVYAVIQMFDRFNLDYKTTALHDIINSLKHAIEIQTVNVSVCKIRRRWESIDELKHSSAIKLSPAEIELTQFLIAEFELYCTLIRNLNESTHLDTTITNFLERVRYDELTTSMFWSYHKVYIETDILAHRISWPHLGIGVDMHRNRREDIVNASSAKFQGVKKEQHDALARHDTLSESLINLLETMFHNGRAHLTYDLVRVKLVQPFESVFAHVLHCQDQVVNAQFIWNKILRPYTWDIQKISTLIKTFVMRKFKSPIAASELKNILQLEVKELSHNNASSEHSGQWFNNADVNAEFAEMKFCVINESVLSEWMSEAKTITIVEEQHRSCMRRLFEAALRKYLDSDIMRWRELQQTAANDLKHIFDIVSEGDSIFLPICKMWQKLLAVGLKQEVDVTTTNIASIVLQHAELIRAHIRNQTLSLLKTLLNSMYDKQQGFIYYDMPMNSRAYSKASFESKLDDELTKLQASILNWYNTEFALLCEEEQSVKEEADFFVKALPHYKDVERQIKNIVQKDTTRITRETCALEVRRVVKQACVNGIMWDLCETRNFSMKLVWKPFVQWAIDFCKLFRLASSEYRKVYKDVAIEDDFETYCKEHFAAKLVNGKLYNPAASVIAMLSATCELMFSMGMVSNFMRTEQTENLDRTKEGESNEWSI